MESAIETVSVKLMVASCFCHVLKLSTYYQNFLYDKSDHCKLNMCHAGMQSVSDVATVINEMGQSECSVRFI